MKITAAQHVSGMLTSKQSPRGQAGYQTLFYTRALLTPEEVRVIERRVQYSAARSSKAKWQSYRLSDQRHVISRIVPIPEPDEFGRRGRYLTHSLICDVDGQRFDAIIFGLLRGQNFLSSLDKVLAASAVKTGDAQTITVDTGNEWINEDMSCLRSWSSEQLNQLYMLMSDPRQLIGQGQHVTLVGNEEQILEALKVAFLLTPAAARKYCSFDTNASGSDAPSQVTFWGRGSETAGSSSHVIDGARRVVTIPKSSSLRANGFSPEEVSAPLRNAISARPKRPSKGMLRCLIERRYATFIGELVYETLMHEGGLNPTATDLELLSAFGRAHDGLGLLLALKSGDDAQRLQTLAAMKVQSYKERIRQLSARHDFKPWQVFSPIFMPTWFDLFQGAYSMNDLTTAITKVAEHGSEPDREYVESIYKHLDPAQRQTLGSWLKASKLRFDRLQAALDKPVRPGTGAGSNGKLHSFLRRITHPFGK
jgi:GTPase-associated protein 1, N-terminal domain type 2